MEGVADVLLHQNLPAVQFDGLYINYPALGCNSEEKGSVERAKLPRYTNGEVSLLPPFNVSNNLRVNVVKVGFMKVEYEWFSDRPVNWLGFEDRFRSLILQTGDHVRQLKQTDPMTETVKGIVKLYSKSFDESANQIYNEMLRSTPPNRVVHVIEGQDYLKRLNKMGFQRVDSQQEMIRYILSRPWAEIQAAKEREQRERYDKAKKRAEKNSKYNMPKPLKPIPKAEYLALKNEQGIPFLWIVVTIYKLPYKNAKADIKGIKDPHCVAQLHAWSKSFLGYISFNENARIGAFAFSLLTNLISYRAEMPCVALYMEALPPTVAVIDRLKEEGVDITLYENRSIFLDLADTNHEPHFIVVTDSLRNYYKKLLHCVECKIREARFAVKGYPEKGLFCSQECFLKSYVV